MRYSVAFEENALSKTRDREVIAMGTKIGVWMMHLPFNNKGSKLPTAIRRMLVLAVSLSGQSPSVRREVKPADIGECRWMTQELGRCYETFRVQNGAQDVYYDLHRGGRRARGGVRGVSRALLGGWLRMPLNLTTRKVRKMTFRPLTPSILLILSF
ncbi:MAG: hypothetical protein QW087_08080, partial [Methanomassiliicoccales archaeon]